MDYNRIFPSITKSEKNIINLVKYGYERGAIGEITSSWGDFFNKEIRENRIYGFIFSAEIGWNPSTPLNYVRYWKGLILHFFGIWDLKLQKIFNTFRNVQNKNQLHTRSSLYYNHFFSHPYNKKSQIYRKNIKTSQFDKVVNELDVVIKNCKDFEKKVRKNSQNIKSLMFVAQHMRFYCKKRINSKKMVDFKPTQSSDDFLKIIINEVSLLKKQLDSLSQFHEELWMACAKKEGFDPIRQKYLWMMQFYERKVNDLEFKNKWQDPNIPSETIYLDSKRIHQVHSTIYQKMINLREEVEHAYLQVIAGTYAKIFINEEYLGHVITRHSLNFVLLNNNIKIFDIKKFLQLGDNLIRIENTDHSGGLGPLNIYGEIKMKEGKLLIIKTDETWVARRDATENWQKVKSLGSPPRTTGGLCYPDFNKNLPSCNADLMASYNEIISRISKRYFQLYKLVLRLFSRYNVVE